MRIRSAGERPQFLEIQVQAALLYRMGDSDLIRLKIRLDRETVSTGGAKLPCIMLIPLMPLQGHVKKQ